MHYRVTLFISVAFPKATRSMQITEDWRDRNRLTHQRGTIRRDMEYHASLRVIHFLGRTGYNVLGDYSYPHARCKADPRSPSRPYHTSERIRSVSHADASAGPLRSLRICLKVETADLVHF